MGDVKTVSTLMQAWDSLESKYRKRLAEISEQHDRKLEQRLAEIELQAQEERDEAIAEETRKLTVQYEQRFLQALRSRAEELERTSQRCDGAIPDLEPVTFLYGLVNSEQEVAMVLPLAQTADGERGYIPKRIGMLTLQTLLQKSDELGIENVSLVDYDLTVLLLAFKELSEAPQDRVYTNESRLMELDIALSDAFANDPVLEEYGIAYNADNMGSMLLTFSLDLPDLEEEIEKDAPTSIPEGYYTLQQAVDCLFSLDPVMENYAERHKLADYQFRRARHFNEWDDFDGFDEVSIEGALYFNKEKLIQCRDGVEELVHVGKDAQEKVTRIYIIPEPWNPERAAYIFPCGGYTPEDARKKYDIAPAPLGKMCKPTIDSKTNAEKPAIFTSYVLKDSDGLDRTNDRNVPLRIVHRESLDAWSAKRKK